MLGSDIHSVMMPAESATALDETSVCCSRAAFGDLERVPSTSLQWLNRTPSHFLDLRGAQTGRHLIRTLIALQ